MPACLLGLMLRNTVTIQRSKRLLLTTGLICEPLRDIPQRVNVMRMWMIDPKLLCRQHLLGEHGEIHKHLPSFRKRHSVSGRFSPVVQIQLNALKERHDELAQEMLRRGMNHKSPLANIPNLKETYPQYYDLNVDTHVSIRDLCQRCPKCRKRIENEKPCS